MREHRVVVQLMTACEGANAFRGSHVVRGCSSSAVGEGDLGQSYRGFGDTKIRSFSIGRGFHLMSRPLCVSHLVVWVVNDDI